MYRFCLILQRMIARDSDIRECLHAGLLRAFHDDPESHVYDEFGLCRGDGRVDIAVVNCQLHGFEIKSGRDSLRRLESQVEVYSKVLDTATLVVHPSHRAKAETIVPQWWGIVEAVEKGGQVEMEERKPRTTNPTPEPLSIALLLWKKELLTALEELGIDWGWRSKTRKEMAERLVSKVSFDEIRQIVRDGIKRRGDWRSETKPSRRDVLCPQLPLW